MVPYWLKPNKVGIALFVVSVLLILIFFGYLVMFPYPWHLYLMAFSVSVAYPISMILGIRVGKKMKILLGVMLVGILCLLIFSVCPAWPVLSRNIGLPFGYYGEFNRVRHRLEQISGVQILKYHQHKDLTLEDFWFTIQLDGGMKLGLEFNDGNKTYELFDHADGLAVQNPNSGKLRLYSFGSDERLEATIGKEVRNAVDVLENFERIAEVLESDLPKGLPETEWKDVPRSYLWIIYPAFFPQPIE